MMNESEIRYIIERLIDNARDAYHESINNPDDVFYKGKKIAYYEVLDTIQGELESRGQNLKNYGFDINLEKELL